MFDAGPCAGMFTVLPRAMRVEYPGAICHVMRRGDWREDILLIGTTKGAKSLLHHLAHEPPQHQSARMNKVDGQLEFQSTGLAGSLSPQPYERRYAKGGGTSNNVVPAEYLGLFAGVMRRKREPQSDFAQGTATSAKLFRTKRLD